MLKLVKHPLIEIKLSKLREKKTKIDEFRKKFKSNLKPDGLWGFKKIQS